MGWASLQKQPKTLLKQAGGGEGGLTIGGAYHWKPRILRFKMGWASLQKQPKTLLKQAGRGEGGAYYRNFTVYLCPRRKI